MNKLYPILLAENKEQLKEGKLSASLSDNSLVANGFLKGNTIDEAIDAYLGALLGDKVFQFYKGMLPLETRVISSAKTTSVSVSPSDEVAVGRWLCFGKARIFYVLKAKHDSSLFLGFQKDMTAQTLYDLMLKGELKSAMNECAPEAGEIYYVAPNTPFAIGGGVELLEISTNSPVTLDIEDHEQFAEALDFINLNKYIPVYSVPDESNFILDTITLTKPNVLNPGELESMVVLFVLNGKVSVSYKGGDDISLGKYSLLLVPHDMEEITITPQTADCQMLRIHHKEIDLLKNEDEEHEHEEHHHHEHCEDPDCECHHGHHHDHNAEC